VNPIFTPNDVSIIVLTLKPHPVFKTCLIRLFENKPAEIIICTTEEHIKEVEHIISEAVLKGVRRSKTKIVVSEKGARKQLMKGVWEAKGKIIAPRTITHFGLATISSTCCLASRISMYV
jgi:hypothetical protein